MVGVDREHVAFAGAPQRLLDIAHAIDAVGRHPRADTKAAAAIEIMFGRLKGWRRVATHYDRCPTVFLSAITLAAIVIFWL